MKTALIRFQQRRGATVSIPWHFSFYKDILEAQGHVVDIIDNQIEEYTIEHLVELVAENEYDLVGTGGIGTTYRPLKAFCDGLKQVKPEVFVVVGGQVIADYEFILQTCNVDVLVQAEGDVTLPKLIGALEGDGEWKKIPGIIYLENGNVIHTEPERPVRLDDLPGYNLKNIKIGKYQTAVPSYFVVDECSRKLKEKGFKYLSIFLARGCPYNCFFCYRHLKGYRTYSRQRLETILESLKESGFSFFSFSDECLTGNKKNLKEVCGLAKKHDLYWVANARSDHLNDDILSMMKSHNCVGVQVGVESFDDRMLAVMNKKTTPQQNIDAMNLLYRYGLRTVLQLVIGAPGENRRTLFNTRRGMWSCYFPTDTIACAILNPYPGSPAYYFGLENGYITDKAKINTEFSSKQKVVVNFSELSTRELLAWRELMHVEAALSWRVKKRRIALSKNFIAKLRRFFHYYRALIKEPLNFVMFTFYVFRGAAYWLRPAPQTAEKNGNN